MYMDKYYQSCLNDIKFHTDKIQEIIKDGLSNPEEYYKQSREQWKFIYNMIPFMYFAQFCESQREGSATVENLQDTPRSNSSGLDNCEPATP